MTIPWEVPGFNANDLEIKVEPSRLLIKGKTGTTIERKAKRTVYTECLANEICRVVSLRAEVNPEKTTAALQDGLLHLTLPKAASNKAVRVEVKAA
jgi:HSP20 family protein